MESLYLYQRGFSYNYFAPDIQYLYDIIHPDYHILFDKYAQQMTLQDDRRKVNSTENSTPTTLTPQPK